MPNVDFSSAPHVRELLETEKVAWLTTIAPSGTPQPTVIWFVWDGEAITVFSQPTSKRLRNLQQNNRVALNFNSDETGSFDAVITGTATINEDAASTDAAKLVPAKYTYEGEAPGTLGKTGLTPEKYFEEYSVAIRIEPERVRGSR